MINYNIIKGNLKNGSTLSSYRADQLISPNSQYIAIMQTNGAFTIYVSIYI